MDECLETPPVGEYYLRVRPIYGPDGVLVDVEPICDRSREVLVDPVKRAEMVKDMQAWRNGSWKGLLAIERVEPDGQQ